MATFNVPAGTTQTLTGNLTGTNIIEGNADSTFAGGGGGILSVTGNANNSVNTVTGGTLRIAQTAKGASFALHYAALTVTLSADNVSISADHSLALLAQSANNASVTLSSSTIYFGADAYNATITYAGGSGNIVGLSPTMANSDNLENVTLQNMSDGDRFYIGNLKTLTVGPVYNLATQTLTFSTSAHNYTLNVTLASGAPTTFTYSNGVFTNTCFLAGTCISTPAGEVPVEALQAGDGVDILMDGVRQTGRVRWIGWRSVKAADLPAEDAYPVRIRAHAFAPDMPHADLLITPEHCVFIDGGLVPARMLVNGGSIVIDRSISAYTYYHVELEQHAILLAEGLPTESYLDTGNRSRFANAAVAGLFPGVHVDAAGFWEQDAAAPLTVDPLTVEPIWQRLRARGVALGHGAAALVTTAEPDLCLEAGGRMMRPVFVQDGRHVFVLRGAADGFRLLSNSARPADARPWLDDRRQLGVCVRRLILDDGTERREIPVDHPALSRGWWETEQADGGLVRWTDGAATFALPVGTCTVEVELSGEMHYPFEAARSGDEAAGELRYAA